MAISSLYPRKTMRNRRRFMADRLDYDQKAEKTIGGDLVSSYMCLPESAAEEFEASKKLYFLTTGRRQDPAHDILMYRIIQSFKPGEITPEEANRLGYELARRFTKGKHAFIVCTHVDKAHIHNHIIWNSTTLDHSRKFRDFLGSGRAVRRLNDTICVQNGYSIVANPKRRGKSYNKWLGSKPPCHRDQLRMAIDAALAQKPADLDALFQLLRDAGIEVSPRGKSIRLKAPGGKQFVRLDGDSMGADYSIPSLLAVLAGEKQHTPLSKNIRRADPPKVNLLVDIQAKLQAGKGAGYARWAKTFNLKQMAQTLNYLTEHGLLDYVDLAAKADEATGRYHELSATIKAAEQRMAEIAVLKTHIINYAKTREVYVAYRKAGYSKKFKAEHESDILLHQAAKKFFDESGLKKLPTIRSLQAEYVALLAEKKAAYADFRKAREDMKELLTVRANVQKLMGYEAQEQEKEADRREEER